MDLNRLAESFSSDVINEAISEIIAEEDLKEANDNRWYRREQEITLPIPGAPDYMPADRATDTASSEKLSQSVLSSEVSEAGSLSQEQKFDIMAKVSPLRTPLGSMSSHSGSATSGRGSAGLADVELPTSQVLKDIPGYMSPNTRSKILNGDPIEETAPSDVHPSRSDDMFQTLMYDERQDTIYEEEDYTRKSISSSYSSSREERNSHSRRPSEVTSSNGSTTVYNSIAGDAFAHKRHLSPLLDMSNQSLQMEKSEETTKTPYSTNSNNDGSKNSSRTSSRFQTSPREQHSRISSTTEYDALPQSMHNSKLSPNISAHLMLSPDLAQRVSAILNHSDESVPKLTFAEDTGTSRDASNDSSPKSLDDRNRMRDVSDSGTPSSQDELDRHVSDVLSRSGHFLESQEKSVSELPLSKRDVEDHSYLDKYMSPRYTSPPVDPSRYPSYRPQRDSGRSETPRLHHQTCTSPRQTSPMHKPTSEDDRRERTISNRKPISRSKKEERVTPRPSSSRLEECDDGINKKYMDKSSREVLEQAAKEYYSERMRANTELGESVDNSPSQARADSSGMTNTSGFNEELIRLADKSHSPACVGSSKVAASTTKYPPSRPSRVVTAPISEAETQSLVSKRLDRIEFMVLSALNEVPPQNKPSYSEPMAAHVLDDADCARSTLDTSRFTDETVYGNDIRDVIKTASPRSPLGSLPSYSLNPECPVPSRRTKEDSFNISISPVKRDPFTTFNRAHELLAERLAQRSNERTPCEKASTRSYATTKPGASPTRSPTRDLARPYPYPERRYEARKETRERNPSGLENIPEPRTLQIEGAGRSPKDSLVYRGKVKGRRHSLSSIESVTTVESTHPGSDDAQPPDLPRDALGTRKEPTTSSIGIYGSRAPPSSGDRTPRSNSEGTPRMVRDTTASARSAQIEAGHSAVGRAEKALLRGNEIRERMIARRQERQSKANVEDVKPVVALLNSTYKSPCGSPRLRDCSLSPSGSPRLRARSLSSSRSPRAVDRPCESHPTDRSCSPHGSPRYKDRSAGKADNLIDRNGNNSANYDKYQAADKADERSVLLDFYRSPRLQTHEPSRLERVEIKTPEEPSAYDSEIRDSRNRVDRAVRLRENSLERVAELKQRALERSLERSPDRASPLDRTESSDLSPRRAMPCQRMPSPYSSRRHRSLSPVFLSDSPVRRRSPDDGLGARNVGVRPLERVDYPPDTREFRSRLSNAVNDRLRTYHILREELMKTEDEVRGRELNLAWQRISKRKPKPPSVLDESTTTTATSTLSSEGFDEERMKKLRSLLNNPLGHLVSKAMKANSRTDKNKSSTQPGHSKPVVKSNKKTYEKLMAKIQQQRREESSLTMEETSSSATIVSVDDTVCTRCEVKRYQKRTKKIDGRKQSRAVESVDSTDGDSKSSSTRPVTPSGLPVPRIQHLPSQSKACNLSNNQSADSAPVHGKILRDVAVMCPSPSGPGHHRLSPPVKQSSKRLQQIANADKGSVAWRIDGYESETKKKQNTFQKSRDIDRQQEGLVWFVPHSNPRPWTKAPLQRRALSVAMEPWMPDNKTVQTAAERRGMNEICEAFNEATGRSTSYVPTLQEAFRERNQRFVSCSRERQRRIKLRSEERQINKVHDEQRAQLFDFQPFSHKHTAHETPRLLSSNSKRAIPKDEMYGRTNRQLRLTSHTQRLRHQHRYNTRVYKVLPEVKNREKMNSIQQERIAYRIKAKLFNKIE